MMMIAMHYVYNLLSSLTFRYPMKNESMHDVLEECPEQHSGQEPDCNFYRIKAKTGCSIIGQAGKCGSVQGPNNQRMRFCKHLQVSVPEQFRLSLIVNLLKLHTSQKYRMVS